MGVMLSYWMYGLIPPATIQQVAEVDDIGIELERVTTTTDVEEEVLSEVEVELVDELRHEGIARSDAATLLSEVTAAGDELLEAVCHLLVSLSRRIARSRGRFAGLVSDRSGEVAVSDFVLVGM